MHRSTIYSHCPSCRADALVQQVADAQRCANCQFDYRTLLHDASAREQWLLDNLRHGPLYQSFVLRLHRLVSDAPEQVSDDQVRAFAKQHGIEIIKRDPLSPGFVVLLVIGLFALAAAGIAVLVRT
jgi:hypothetical protein